MIGRRLIFHFERLLSVGRIGQYFDYHFKLIRLNRLEISNSRIQYALMITNVSSDLQCSPSNWWM